MYYNVAYLALYLFQFNSYSPVNGRIKEVDFCEILLTYATLTEARKRKMIKRIKKQFKTAESEVRYGRCRIYSITQVKGYTRFLGAATHF